MNIAFVGVGAMGAPMAACIARAGHSVTVYDSSQERVRQVAADHGCQAATSIAGLAGADFVVTMLPTGQIVRDLYLREGLAQQLRRDTIAIDMSSSGPPRAPANSARSSSPSVSPCSMRPSLAACRAQR